MLLYAYHCLSWVVCLNVKQYQQMFKINLNSIYLIIHHFSRYKKGWLGFSLPRRIRVGVNLQRQNNHEGEIGLFCLRMCVS